MDKLEFYDLSALYRLFTHLACIEERKERQKSETERRGILRQPPWFFYVPGVQLRYTGLPFYVPTRRTLMNTMDIYHEKMNYVGPSSWYQTRVFRLKGETCNRSTTAAPSVCKGVWQAVLTFIQFFMIS